MGNAGIGEANKLKAARRREQFLAHVRGNKSVAEAMTAVGWRSQETYLNNRRTDPTWAKEVDAATGYSPRTRQTNNRSAASTRRNPAHRGPNRWAIQVYGQQDNFISQLEAGLSVAESCAAVGWTNTNSYRKWRSRDPEFARRADEILASRVRPPNVEQLPAGPKIDKETGHLWTPSDGFLGFRKTFLDHESPWFHLQAIEAIEQLPGGSVLLILWPPLHGKSSLYEDYDIFRISTDPGVRITIGSEKLEQAKKFLGLVRDKLDNDAAGMGALHRRFGPFAPQPRAKVGKGAVARQKWGAAAFDVYKKPRGMQGQRDPTMQALGMGSGITGTRCDILQVDDPQSRDSLRKKGNTEQLVDNFRQDWLSRPGKDGITVILMNRVGEGDFPEYLETQTELVDRVIRVKAWDPKRGGWAWPEVHSQQFYLDKRKQVGEDAWQRNYMQVGLSNKDATFTNAILGMAKNPMRSVLHKPPRPPSGMECEVIICIDPGRAKSSFHVWGLHPDRMFSLDLRLLENAKAYGVFGDTVDELCQQFCVPGLSVVTHVIVETKAFQYFLLTDPQMLAAQIKWNFQLVPFETGKTKNDPDFGVPQVARMMERGEIDFPDADDQSRERYDSLYRQSRRWRPGVLGKDQEMDHVMTTWFGCHFWNQRRRTLGASNSSAFNFR